MDQLLCCRRAEVLAGVTSPTQETVAQLAQSIDVGLHVRMLIKDDTKISCLGAWLDDTVSYGEGADGQLVAESGRYDKQ